MLFFPSTSYICDGGALYSCSGHSLILANASSRTAPSRPPYTHTYDDEPDYPTDCQSQQRKEGGGNKERKGWKEERSDNCQRLELGGRKDVLNLGYLLLPFISSLVTHGSPASPLSLTHRNRDRGPPTRREREGRRRKRRVKSSFDGEADRTKEKERRETGGGKEREGKKLS